jgi:diadenosine tetraphosphate (Ap4A) HIT family hydrolase
MDWREDRIGSAARGQNPTVLKELRSGYAVIGDVQFLPGYCVLLGKDPAATALAEMPRPERVRFLTDVDLLATAVETACRANDPAFRRVNIDILGNADAFVHAHIWPRYEWSRPSLYGGLCGCTTSTAGGTQTPRWESSIRNCATESPKPSCP